MKEIKFRAWDKLRRKFIRSQKLNMISFYGKCYDYSYCKDTNQDELTYFDEKDIILMQFTGLKDKNGKEIYEGDILRVESYGGIEIVKVKFDEDYAGWDFYKGEECCPLTDYKNTMGFDLNAEVIGNIYENPELLGDIE